MRLAEIQEAFQLCVLELATASRCGAQQTLGRGGSQGLQLDGLDDSIRLGPAAPESARLQNPVFAVGGGVMFPSSRRNITTGLRASAARRRVVWSRWMTRNRASTHLSQTDFAVLYPNWMALLVKTSVHVKRPIHQAMQAAIELPDAGVAILGSSGLAVAVRRQWGMLVNDAAAETENQFDHRLDNTFIAARMGIFGELSRSLGGFSSLTGGETRARAASSPGARREDPW
ncbi:hypothetical protein QBC39DRAFT_403586 [Podospora conica]|nr:hypothetical protein QBC39DRAFT_403586 [Schizothecium conicum]